ncbi:MAG: DUF4126 domain-containing protein [Candidatus Competibacteraceae bacterium]|nr:DUF4126 domain-containing protein [Candidatus Competibacteraceae bacterium]
MDPIHMIALTMGTAWASGINLYATVFMLGILNATGNMVLPEELQILSDPLVLAAAGFMYCVEFFADKIPGVDTGWGYLAHLHPYSGRCYAGCRCGRHMGPGAELAAALIGGSMSATSHAVKAGSRVMINTSPEPFTNWFASITEDVAVIGGLWAALYHPWVFLVGLVIFLLLLIWLLPKLWRGIVKVFSFLGRLLSGGSRQPPPPPPSPS